MSEFNQKFIMEHSEDSNYASNQRAVMGVSATENRRMPRIPRMPDVDGDASTFSDKTMKNMPPFVREAASRIRKPRTKAQMRNFYGLQDIATLAVLGVASSALPNVRFLYRRDWYYSPLMVVVVANAGMGKGVMESIFKLLEPICRHWRKKYEAEMKAYKDQQTLLGRMSKKELKNYNEELLERPMHYLFRIPTDSTYAAFIKALGIMNGTGAVLDTEIDTLLQSFAQNMGDYSVLIRKNFKHEQHEWYRKTDDEHGMIAEPKFSLVMSGTIDQMETFVNNISNGFFSRLLYYFYNVPPVWEDAEDERAEKTDDKTFYETLGQKIYRLYQKLGSLDSPVRFCLDDRQRKKMNAYFKTVHANFIALEGDEFHASVVRLAVSFQRLALLLTLLRLTDKTDEELDEILKQELTCQNKDFNSALTISKVLLQHASAYYEELQEREAKDEEEVCQVLPADFGREDVNKGFNALPSNRKLTREDIVKTLTDNGVPESTASKYIAKFVKSLRLRRICYNQYQKCTDEEYLILKRDAKPRKAVKGRKQDKKSSCS